MDPFEITDMIFQYTNLPEVTDIPSESKDSYYETAKLLRKHCIPDLLNRPEVADFPKFTDWCKYITRFNTCNIAPHPSEFSRYCSSTW